LRLTGEREGTMKITAMAVATMLGTAAIHGQSPKPEMMRSVTVCLNGDVAKSAAFRAEVLVSQMFAGIGLVVVWHNNVRDCPTQEIRVALHRGAPATLKPGALAYAQPYEGTYIEIFYDRISGNWEPGMVPVILTHVLAHEITHILEGINRHSRYGIMKAHWDAQDYFQMRFKPLEFAPEDIDLIYRGLAFRSHSPMLVANAKQTHE
jgi:hypothetical protein